MNDRQATQQFAMLNVLIGHCDEKLTSAKIEAICAELVTEMTNGPCAWAFQEQANDGYWLRTMATEEQIAGLLAWIAEAVGVLRQHVYCGDNYPEDGWPEVLTVLAHYKQLERSS